MNLKGLIIIILGVIFLMIPLPPIATIIGFLLILLGLFIFLTG